MDGIKTVRFSFLAPVHFGSGRLSDGAISCDAATLFSALYIEALGCGEADGLLDAARTGKLSLSDAFPYIDKTLYLPKPMVIRDIPEDGDRTKNTLEKKATKKLPFIPAARYQSFLNASMDALDELEQFKGGIGSSFLQTKVNLTREHKEDAEPYHVGGFQYRPGSGIYFMVRGDYDLKPLLDQLQYSGIGGERSSGYGRFKYQITDENPIRLAAGGGGGQGKRGRSTKKSRQVLLATAGPSEDEMSDYLMRGARYKLVRKGGFVQSATHSRNPQKKRDLYLFSSGSTFARTFEGDVYDVNATPGAQHPVYRYARAMWMEV